MADFDGVITPVPAMTDVPSLGVTARALGGPGGPMNAQAQALLNRMVFYKNQLDNHNKLQVVYASEFPANGVSGANVDPSGALISTKGLQRAIDFASQNKKTLLVEGTPLFDETLNFTNSIRVVFAGGSSNPNAGSLPQSYFKKAATLSGDGIYVTGGGSVFEGGGVVGVSGNGGDLAHLAADRFAWLGHPAFHGGGRDNLRLGVDSGIVDSNSIYIEGAFSADSGRHGIHVHDALGSSNVNAFLLSHPNCIRSGGNAIHLNNTIFGGTIIAPTLQTNVGYGIYFDTNARNNVVIGGDVEANDAGNVFEANAYANRLVEVCVQGVLTNSSYKTGNFTPVVKGGTTAGVGTYTTQKGYYNFNGGVINFGFEISWTGHTGTGQLCIDLPNLVQLQTVTYIPNVPTFIPVDVVSNGIAVPMVGDSLVGLVFNTTVPPRVQIYIRSNGGISAQVIPPSGTIYVSGVVPLINL